MFSLVCLRKRLRKLPTFIYLFTISVSDATSLSIWNLNHFLFIYFNLQPEFKSLIYCKIGVFLQYVSLEYSAWLLVMLTLDRYIHIRKKIAVPNNNNSINRKHTKITILVCILTFFVIFLLNSHILGKLNFITIN